MRKLYISLLLPLLMLLAQQGAAWHEIGHLRGGDTPPASTGQQQADKKLSVDKFCELCLSFAQLGSTAKADAPSLHILSFGFAFARPAAVPAISADAPAQRSRGPPSFA